MSLETDAPTALLRVRSTFASLAQAAAVADTRPAGIALQLGLHKSLARKLSHLVTSDSPNRIWESIPGRAGVDIALEAFISHGASHVDAEGARESLAELESVVSRYAQDREQFTSMLAELDPAAAEPVLRAAREQMYRGAAGTIGASTDWTVRIDVLVPPVGHGTADVLSAKGTFGFLRLRAGGPMELGRLTVVDDESGDRVASARQPLFVGGSATDVPLWPEFCGPGAVPVTRTASDSGDFVDRLGTTPTGLPGRRDIVFAERMNGLPSRYRTDEHTVGRHTHRLRFPSVRFCMLHIVHASLAGTNPRASVHTLATTDPGDAGFDWDATRVPCGVDVAELGPDLAWADLAGEPRIAPMVDQLVSATGLDRSEFTGHRLTIEFPPVFCCVSFAYDLPRRPAR